MMVTLRRLLKFSIQDHEVSDKNTWVVRYVATLYFLDLKERDF